MRKLYATTSKDDYAIVLDILEVNGIYEEHSTSLNENSEKIYSIFCSEEDFDKANEILNEQDFESKSQIIEEEELSEPDFSDYDNDELVWLIADVEEEQERREQAVSELQKRGMTTEDINSAVENEIKKDNKPLKLDLEETFFDFVSAIALGVPAIKKGYSYYTAKKFNTITNKEEFAYTEQSRKIALAMIVFGMIVGGVELVLLISVFF